MIRIESLSFAYGRKRIIRNLDLDLRSGETVMITGPNAAGKSTLLRLMAGVLKPSEGRIDYGFPEGTDPRSRIAFLPDSLSFYGSMTPNEVAGFHAGFFGTEPSGLQVARRAGVDLNRRIEDLSLGQKVIVQLSIVLSTDPDIVLIDEVLHAVDPYLRGLMFQELIGVMEERDPTVVMINLNFSEVENLVDRVIFMGRDGVRLDERVDDLKAHARLLESGLEPVDAEVLLAREVLGRKQFVLYPCSGNDGVTTVGSRAMDLTEILTAFMEAEYDDRS
ncbi:MAG: hypothetical protein AVO35_07975 [Candidatus Aegiribacteria sp. MLS_C]|nr:MAG: hypothetical protein AVO35_07975 [Candidatus Aegiribacteria sp. MLS_C]